MREVHRRIAAEERGRERPRSMKHHLSLRGAQRRRKVKSWRAAALSRPNAAAPTSDWCGGTRARAPAPHEAPFVIARSEATKQSGRRRRDRHGLPAVLGGLAMTTKTFRVNEEQHQACCGDPPRGWPWTDQPRSEPVATNGRPRPTGCQRRKAQCLPLTLP
jgi:hypothetical protein